MSFGNRSKIEVPTVSCGSCSAALPLPVPESCGYCGNAIEPQARANINGSLQTPDALTGDQLDIIDTLTKYPYIPGALSLLDKIPDSFPGKAELERRVMNHKGSHVTTSGRGFSGHT